MREVVAGRSATRVTWYSTIRLSLPRLALFCNGNTGFQGWVHYGRSVPVEPVFPMESPSTSVLRLREEISLFSGMGASRTVGRHLSRRLFRRNEALRSIYGMKWGWNDKINCDKFFLKKRKVGLKYGDRSTVAPDVKLFEWFIFLFAGVPAKRKHKRKNFDSLCTPSFRCIYACIHYIYIYIK